MKPAICAVCGKFGSFEGDSIEFADYKPLPKDFDGHPEGFECFCNDHLEAARALAHLPSREAITLLRGQFDYPLDGPREPEPHCPQCSQRNWSHHDLAGQNELRGKVSWIAGRIAWIGYGVFLVGVLFFNLPWFQIYTLICLGALITIIPAYFLAKRLESAIESQIHLCKSCGYVANGSQYAGALQQEEDGRAHTSNATIMT